MNELKAALIIGVGVLLYLVILGYAATHSQAAIDQRAYYVACETKGGQMIPRTLVCIKKEAIIQP